MSRRRVSGVRSEVAVLASSGLTSTRKADPLGFSSIEMLELIVSSVPFWELVAEYDRMYDERPKIGRPPTIEMAGLVLFECATWEYQAYRKVGRELADPGNWARIYEAPILAHPDRKEWRFSAEPPTREQHKYRMAYFTKEWRVERLSEFHLRFSLEVAERLGIGQGGGSVTHPAVKNVMIGDATWIPALYESTVDRVVDRVTGEIRTRRIDPDAESWGANGFGAGKYLVSILARNRHPDERVIFCNGFKPKWGPTDGTIFCDWALPICEQFPDMQALVYDKAITAADLDRIMDSGRIPVVKVPRNEGGAVKTRRLGQHRFKFVNGTKKDLTLWVEDGTPALLAVAGGEKHLVLLDRIQTIRRTRAGGGVAIYGEWETPDDPRLPIEQRGATVFVRHNSKRDERLKNDTRRTQVLRPIPASDPDFGRIFGCREDVEAMHRHLKERLWCGRARRKGLLAQQLNLQAYQFRTNLVALVAHALRTRASLEPFFGRWKPPERVSAQRAA